MLLSVKGVEKMLYDFPINLRKYQSALEELAKIRELTDCKAQSYSQTPGKPSGHSDPTAMYVGRVLVCEEILNKYSQLVEPVMLLRNELKNAHNENERLMFAVLELHFFDGMTLKDLALHMQRSKKTITLLKKRLISRGYRVCADYLLKDRQK